MSQKIDHPLILVRFLKIYIYVKLIIELESGKVLNPPWYRKHVYVLTSYIKTPESVTLRITKKIEVENSYVIFISAILPLIINFVQCQSQLYMNHCMFFSFILKKLPFCKKTPVRLFGFLDHCAW